MSIYQRSLKADVARLSGIPFAALARMPFPQWALIRAHYCGHNNQLTNRRQPS